jgi:hypothetical protein
MPEATIKLIVDTAAEATENWRASDSDAMGLGTMPLRTEHIVMAVLLDALYKHHFASTLGRDSLDSMPSDEDLQKILHAATGKCEGFKPSARETMQILYNDFDQLPHLKDIPPSHRWRLIVDRQKIDMLSKHGIDTSNPLLCFIFDTDASYAHGLAQGLKFMGQCLDEDRDLDVGLILDLAKACGGHDFSARTVKFGAHFSCDGRKALADWMQKMAARYHINSIAVAGTDFVGCFTNQVRAGPFDPDEARQSFDDAAPSDLPVADLVETMAAKAPLSSIHFLRNHATRDTLLRALGDIVSAFKESAATAEGDAMIEAAATAYFEGEHLHPLKDGNFRVFGLVLLNFLLCKNGEGMTLIYDPNTSDGRSPRELVDVVKEGQKWLKSLQGQTDTLPRQSAAAQ